MNINPIKWSAVLVTAALAISCEDDVITEHNSNGAKVTIAFESEAKTVAENASEETVTLTLSKPLVADAELTLKADNSIAENFTASPAIVDGIIRIPLLKGATAATLKLLPVDNAEKDGDRVGNLRLQSLSVPFITGTNSAMSITITDDDGGAHLTSVANFIEQSITLAETATTWIDYQVHFSEAVPTDSEVKIAITAEKGSYGIDYISEPAAENDIVTLQVTSGLRVITFRVRPVDNARVTGDLKVNLSISETSGAIQKGNKLQQVFTITDDELAGKPKGYEVTAASDVVKRFYEYDEQGRVAKVNWQNYSPYLTEGTEIYHYDANSRIVRIEKYPGREVFYHWTGDRITKSETIWHGVLHEYNEYDYDDAGNLGGVVSYHRQNDGSFAKGFYTVYLYFTDGNLYKSLTYQDSGDPENPYLVSTRTYDNYIEVDNPFPMTEVLPNMKMQKNLATTYRVEEAGFDFLYQMTYEFDDDGKPTKRIATAGSHTQTAVYHYY